METNIELRQFRYFIATAEELNFTKAAERLKITKPTLSRQIQSLEKSLGITLLERANHKISLTTAGETFLVECRQILKGIEQSIQLTKKVANGEVGQLVMGFERVINNQIILQIVRQFHTDFPGVDLVIQEMSSGKQIEALRQKKMAVGLIDPIIATPDIQCISLVKEPLVAVVSERHPLAGMEHIALKDLAADLWVTSPNNGNCGLLKRMLEACQEAGFYPQIRQEANDIQMMLSFVTSEFGVTLLPLSARTLARPGVRFIPLLEPVPEVEVAIARLADTPSLLIDSLFQTVQSLATGDLLLL